MTAPARDGWTIGAVLQRLRPEFPDVTISKIRFLEAEGLIRPERTASGYRRFTQDDLARLRYVLAAQRDHYLPLRVIKDQLDRADRGVEPLPVTAVVRPLAAVQPPVAELPEDPGPELRLTRDELIARTDIGHELLSDLEEYGLLAAGESGFYDAEAVQIVRLASGLAEFGIEPRHLRAFRTAVDREVGLVAQVVAPMYRQRDPHAHERADAIARDIAALTVGLHSLLVKSGLRRITGR